MAPYSPEDTFISMLSEEHMSVVEMFKSENPELNEFLQKDAAGYQRLHIGTTYLLFRKSDNKLLAYVTLSMGALKLPEKKEEFIFAGKKLSDYPKDFPNQLPALLIGKLATDKNEEGKNAATILLKHGVRLAIEQRRTIGCAFLVAHVYTKPEIIKWYERKFFKRIVQNAEGRETIPMYFELGI